MAITTTFAPIPAPVVTSPMSATKSPTKRRRKEVSFYPKVSVKYCLHRNNYTAEERHNTWMTNRELQMIRSECHKFAREFSHPSKANDSVSQNGIDILRGLEGKTSQGLARRKRVKAAARNAVFEEQNFQIITGIYDVNALADVYYEHSEYAQIDAHMKGLRDHVEALVAPSTRIATPPVHGRKRTLKFSPKRESAAITTPTSAVVGASCRPRFLSSTSSRRLLTDNFFNF
eukprot:CAMPEP_0197269300 /NCGR_PEP_ID=MMETSP1432-20130617/4852_1 /TAXON_ID=44447 /ORGANISM="Pseudo-nitzschia delicatissima, Strain UNC1205" /LENGTH=230 /DNA_ID=CAMNT_0042734423 /DNA_START=18 /DNA_END=710 /DNA_ORIENTATION=-